MPGTIGIALTLSAAADLVENIVTNNGTGVLITRGAAADIVGNTFSSNLGNGMTIVNASVGEFSADVIFGSAPNTFENNGARGVFCNNNSVIDFNLVPQVFAGNTLGDVLAVNGCVRTGG